MAFDLREELEALCRLFDSGKIEYAICGGMAVAIHGYPRFTKDLDILVREEDVPRIQQLVEELGYTIRTGMIPFDFGTERERRIFRISKIRDRDSLMLDLIIVTPILEQIWSERERFLLGNGEIQVVSRQGLIKMKQMAGRPIDQGDLTRFTTEEPS
jgi:hypothetical protein